MPAREIATWLGALPRAPVDGELRLLLSPRASMSFASLPATPPSGRVTVLIGPEGGFSAAEEAAATDYGFHRRRSRPARVAHGNRGHRGAGGAGRALGRLVSNRANARRLRLGAQAGAEQPKAKARRLAGLLVSVAATSALHRRNSGERIKHPERHLPLGPEFGRFAEHVEQRLAPFLVELLRDRQLLRARSRSPAANPPCGRDRSGNRRARRSSCRSASETETTWRWSRALPACSAPAPQYAYRKCWPSRFASSARSCTRNARIDCTMFGRTVLKRLMDSSFG